ncbi:MAG: hypothetical protein V1755_13940 [Chloroflexota bacterium]
MTRISLGAAALLVMVSAACAPAAPTVDPAQVQASAMAAASTMIAMTQAAIPTATEVPPTPSPTPLPSPFAAALPTVVAPTIEPTKSADSCNQLLDVAASGGKKATLKINNLTKGSVTITIGLSTKNAFGQCGYLSWIIPPKNSIIVNPPQTGPGPCYWAYAWVNDPKNPSLPAPPPMFCMNSTDKYELDVGAETMRITPP